MGIVNQRLQTLADDNHLRAPTYAGFRPGHTVEDLALVLQVAIQQANVNKQQSQATVIDISLLYGHLED